MGTLLVLHNPSAYLMTPRLLEFGGKLEFRNSSGETITLPRPVVDAMEIALHATTEFFPVRIEYQGTVLYYRLILRGPKYTEAAAETLRLQLIAKIGEILLSHPKIRDIKFKFNKIEFDQLAPH